MPVAYSLSTDRSSIDVDVVHRYLAEESYWARGRAREAVERSIANSVCVGAYELHGRQVGFARAVTDTATFAWLADVFVLPEHRGRGLGKRMVQAVLDHPDLAGVPRWLLATVDAHELYRPFGFAAIARIERLMEIDRRR